MEVYGGRVTLVELVEILPSVALVENLAECIGDFGDSFCSLIACFIEMATISIWCLVCL